MDKDKETIEEIKRWGMWNVVSVGPGNGIRVPGGMIFERIDNIYAPDRSLGMVFIPFPKSED